MKIVVLAGGISPERNVSLSSGSLIANALCESGHQVALVDLFLGIEKLEDLCFTSEGKFNYSLGEIAPDIDKLKLTSGHDEDIGPNVIKACHMADLVFVALHGGIGENGVLQSVLEKEGIPYTGSSSLGCKLSMDKGVTKEILVKNNIPTAKWLEFKSEDVSLEKIEEEIGIPCVIKPNDGGSSVGVTLVFDKAQLGEAINEAKKTSSKILVEQFIKGREFSVGVLLGKPLPPIEIIPKLEFYDYKTKYVPGFAEEKCPCDITSEQDSDARDVALKTHISLSLGSYSRTDVILNECDGRFYVLEVNALPGMTPMSLLPQEARCIGIEYNDLCQQIANDALKKKD